MAATYIPSPERRAPLGQGIASGMSGATELLQTFLGAKQAGLNLARAQSAVNTAALEEEIKKAEAANAPAYYKGRADQETAKAGIQLGNLFHQPRALALADQKKQADIAGTDAETTRKFAATALLNLQGYGQQYRNTYIYPLLQQQAEKRVGQIQQQTDEAKARTQVMEQTLAQKKGEDKFTKDLRAGILAKDHGVLDQLAETDPSNMVWQALIKADPFKGPLYDTFMTTGNRDLAETIAEGQVKKFIQPAVRVGRGRYESNPQFDAAVKPLVDTLLDRFNQKRWDTALKNAPDSPTSGTSYWPPPTTGVSTGRASSKVGVAANSDKTSRPPPVPSAAPATETPAAVEDYDPSKTYGDGASVRAMVGGKQVTVQRMKGQWVTTDGQ